MLERTPACSAPAGGQRSDRTDPAAEPAYLLFSQHGWADTNRAMLKLGRAVASADTEVVAPNLGYLRTWLGIEPLIAAVEASAAAALERHPAARLRIIGHSMGGLIWLEVLNRHPEWWPRTDRLVLLGTPVGGAELAALLNTIGLAVGRDLLRSRRELAELVTAGIPTLVVVGDALPGHDGTVSHQSARLERVRFIAVHGVTHVTLRSSPAVQGLIRAFFDDPSPVSLDDGALIARLRELPGLQPADGRFMKLARVFLQFAEGTTVRAWLGVPGSEFVYLVDPAGECRFAGYLPVGRTAALRRLLADLKRELGPALVS